MSAKKAKELCSGCNSLIPAYDLHRCWCGQKAICMDCQQTGRHARCIDKVRLKPSADPVAGRGVLDSLGLRQFMRLATK